jgi:acetylornithine deacetylase/succinyl-diaminopimelate desuccinylase-like protein
MDIDRLTNDANGFWDAIVLDTLRKYIKVPAKSPAFDTQWGANGKLDEVVELAREWVEKYAPKGTIVKIFKLSTRTPVLLIDVPANGGSDQTVLLYGHLDKQPEMGEWDSERDLHPWKPVDIRDEQGHRLYGRGAADDGYAVFAAIVSILCLRDQGLSHARCVILIETSEESGSPDLPSYLDAFKSQIGTPSLIIALDSGCGTYDRLWVTNSLRGLVLGTLRVDVLTEAVHSGDAGGVVADSFRLARAIIDRIEGLDGNIKLADLSEGIPSHIYQQADEAARVIGSNLTTRFPFAQAPPATSPVDGGVTAVLNRTWRPSLAVTGADGLPAISDAGNVIRPFTALKLAIRIPPNVDSTRAAQAVRDAVHNVKLPSYAKLSFDPVGHDAWCAPKEVEWLTEALDSASTDVFGHSAVRMGEGGTIPFMGLLGRTFPNAQFLITGVLGPGANAHGPNEFLHVDYAKGLTACVAHILHSHARAFAESSVTTEVPEATDDVDDADDEDNTEADVA